jgi:hypothetical protein
LTRSTPTWILVVNMKLPAGVYVQVLTSAGLGAGYGLWGLEAASPLAIPLILWAAMVLLLV